MSTPPSHSFPFYGYEQSAQLPQTACCIEVGESETAQDLFEGDANAQGSPGGAPTPAASGRAEGNTESHCSAAETTAGHPVRPALKETSMCAHRRLTANMFLYQLFSTCLLWFNPAGS